jgi:hypothetical protein
LDFFLAGGATSSSSSRDLFVVVVGVDVIEAEVEVGREGVGVTRIAIGITDTEGAIIATGIDLASNICCTSSLTRPSPPQNSSTTTDATEGHRCIIMRTIISGNPLAIDFKTLSSSLSFKLAIRVFSIVVVVVRGGW